jgi:FkbM family methyltransferase
VSELRRRVALGCHHLGSALLRLAGRLQHGPPPGPRSFPNPRFDPARHAERVRQFHEGNLYHHLLDWDLGPDSVVLDVGGYLGDFAANIFCRYLSTVHVFEPVPAYCVQMRQRFVRNPRVHVHEMGLAGETRDEKLFSAEAGSSTFVDRLGAGEPIPVRLARAADVLQDLGLARVDLMKVNIEGGEYELLEHLLEAGWAPRVRNFCIQFHEEVLPDAPERMRAIQAGLARTHRPTFQYEFVWENWQLRDPPEAR